MSGFIKLCVIAVLSGALFGAAFVLVKRFAEWIFEPPDDPTDRPRFV